MSRQADLQNIREKEGIYRVAINCGIGVAFFLVTFSWRGKKK
jgi:hypothetical protein